MSIDQYKKCWENKIGKYHFVRIYSFLRIVVNTRRKVIVTFAPAKGRLKIIIITGPKLTLTTKLT